MKPKAFSLYFNFLRVSGIFVVGLLLLAVLSMPVLGVVEYALAADKTCDVTTSFNAVSPGTTITISWRTSGYSRAVLNGESVTVGSGTKTFTVTTNTTYRLEASNGPGTSKCTVSTTVICRQPTPPISPVDPKPPVDPRDPNPPTDPVVPPPVTPNPPITPTPPTPPVPPTPPTPPVPPTPPPTPIPIARAYLSIWTDGFVTPINSGERTIAETANISQLEWSSVNAVLCEGRGFTTGGAVIGNLTARHVDVAIDPGQTKDFAVRCKNNANIWSDWQSVRIIKASSGGQGSNRAPSAPVISGADENTTASVTGVVNQNIPFTLKATDPDGDDIVYRIDWDKNGSVDRLLPARGYVRSGTPLSVTNSWSVNGVFSFQAQARDSRGNTSGWSSHSIQINDIPTSSVRPTPPQVILEIDRALVRIGDTVATRVRIVADYEVACRVYGVAGGVQTFTHAGSSSERVYSYRTDALPATQLIRAVCTPNIPGEVMATEVREKRVAVIPSVEER
jgi:hypothetical protein